MHCAACENFSISQFFPEEEIEFISPQRIVNLALENECQSICMTYNEPTIYYEYLIDLAKCTHENNLFFILNTNAYVNKDFWKNICRATDAMNIDWKGSAKLFLKYTNAKSYVIEERIKEAYNYGIHIEISVPLFYNKEIEIEMRYLGQFLSFWDKNIPCHLLKIYAAHNHKKTTTDEDIKRAKSALSFYMNNISCH